MPQHAVDLERLFRLRVVVARVGEMDLAQWWNTRGQLSRLGAAAVRRGLPRTHWFAQARSVFAVAAHRCDEVFNPPGSVTLWRLPEDLEERFDARWEHWLDNARDWDDFFERVAAVETPDLAGALRALGLLDEEVVAAAERLPLAPGARSLQLPTDFSGTEADADLLTLGFSRGSKGSVVVPYARLGG
ncbi:MAG: BrxE family protein [Chloroflexi bacterium]|nr:BrxE family protein [Chloroflexota bacterium]